MPNPLSLRRLTTILNTRTKRLSFRSSVNMCAHTRTPAIARIRSFAHAYSIHFTLKWFCFHERVCVCVIYLLTLISTLNLDWFNATEHFPAATERKARPHTHTHTHTLVSVSCDDIRECNRSVPCKSQSWHRIRFSLSTSENRRRT